MMGYVHASFDHSTMAEAFSRPGIDTRSWVSFGVVERGGETDAAVEFDSEYGQVLVNVVLQPSNLHVRCRVAASLAGNGEGEFFPFIENDEVIVAIPGGDERAGCTIIGRLNNVYDAFPTDVAGQDPTKNNFAFRRLRTPYIVETASSYLVRSAVSKAFWSIDQAGELTFSDGNNNMMHVGADFIGMASGDNKVLCQLDLHKNRFVVDAAGSKFVLDGSDSSIVTPGTLRISTAGAPPTHHVTTTESVVAMLEALLVAMGVAFANMSPGPVTGTLIAGLFNPVASKALINTMLVGAGAVTMAPYVAALTSALSQSSDSTGMKPGVGEPGFMV